MTVKDLIEVLETLDPEMDICFDTDTGSRCEVKQITSDTDEYFDDFGIVKTGEHYLIW